MFETIVELIIKHARNIYPSVSIAQFILESGLKPDSGSLSKLADAPNYNLFGIKTHDGYKGKVAVFNTQEDDGTGKLYTIKAKFRAYDSHEDSVIHHEAMFDTEFSKTYYAYVLSAKSAREQAGYLEGTYATDTRYEEKLIELIDKYNLEKYDTNFRKGEGVMSKALKAIEWFESKKGKVTYSMDYRNGPNSYDCSSSVYSALIYAGILPRNTWLGNTETLYALEGKLLIPISRSEIRKGDLFVSGVKGQSLGSGGHTGMVYSPTQIIHCNYYDNGITITQIDGRSGTPLHFYRIKDSGSSADYKTIAPTTYECTIDSLRVHSDTIGTASVVDTLKKGDTKIIDRIYTANGYEWASYISYKGDRRYFPVKTTDGKRVFAQVASTQTKLPDKPAATISQETGKAKVLDDDYDLVINGVEWKLVRK
ncbi:MULTISPECIES: peptidoglycan amidohydrolase family protein [unclassified Facklamia]|uniref:peptidoglycan amidohydrolase family protein n=1 Tax=Aerococcaceae TaxID=186827 RepID=UPI0013D26939|nr:MULTISPECIES: peptidoglycan amidohydrolase family protein [unclassified Facklamia]QQD64706.1 glucosaminidase domain-containing protein [Aerococcaceae bacterium zg-252]